MCMCGDDSCAVFSLCFAVWCGGVVVCVLLGALFDHFSHSCTRTLSVLLLPLSALRHYIGDVIHSLLVSDPGLH